MLQRFLSSRSSILIQIQTKLNKLHKSFIFTVNSRFQSSPFRHQQLDLPSSTSRNTFFRTFRTFTLFIYNLIHQFFPSKIIPNMPSTFINSFRKRPHYTNNPGQQALYTLILKQDISSSKLSHNTSKRPNIDSVIVFAPHYNFRCPVRPTLNIRT